MQRNDKKKIEKRIVYQADCTINSKNLIKNPLNCEYWVHLLSFRVRIFYYIMLHIDNN